MAEIRKFPWLRHLRCEPSVHVLRHTRGRLTGSGRGLSFWFTPMTTAVAEVPMDDRDLPVLFHGRTRDYQDVAVQGIITWRVADPGILADRIDFTIDLVRGHYIKQPLDQTATLITGLAQQAATQYLADQTVRNLLEAGPDPVQARIREGLRDAALLGEMGLAIVAVRIVQVSPAKDLEGALQTPTREKIQEEADRAVFERRARAVQEERAIAENEMESQVELARREEKLIAQRGLNERHRVEEEAKARFIEQKARGERDRIDAAARADRIRIVEEASIAADRERMEIYRDLPAGIILGLAARELAGKIRGIDHLNITPDLMGPLLADLVQAGTRHLTVPGKE